MIITDGKLIQRSLTGKELRLQAEADAEKLKKFAKKDPKKPVDEPDPELEAQRQLLLQQEEDEEKQARDAFESLEPEQQFYSAAEDKYKSSFITFQEPHSENQLTGNDLIILEERVCDDHGDWLYFYRHTTLTSEALAKAKSTKSKTYQPSDLDPIILRCWIDLTDLSIPGETSITKKSEFQVVHQSSEIVAESLKTYIHFTFSTKTPVVPLYEAPQPGIADVIPSSQTYEPGDQQQKCLESFQGDLKQILESLAIEYFDKFHINLNMHWNTKANDIFAVQKPTDVEKRKNDFLYDLNMSGKYKILNDLMRKGIAGICRHHFKINNSISGITTDQHDQFYSELYVFLMEQKRIVMENLIGETKQMLKVDVIPDFKQAEKEIQTINKEVINETEAETYSKLADEYKSQGMMKLAESNIRKLLSVDKANVASRQKGSYAQAEQLLTESLALNPTDPSALFQKATFQIQSGEYHDAYVILLHLLSDDRDNLKLNYLMKYLCEICLEIPYMADRYKVIIERIKLASLGQIPQRGQHQIEPNADELPNLIPIPTAQYLQKPPVKGIVEETPEPAQESKHLSPEQWDDIAYLVMDDLQKGRFTVLLEKIQQQIFNQENERNQAFLIPIFISNGRHDEANELIDILLEKSSGQVNLMIDKASSLYLAEAAALYTDILRVPGIPMKMILLRLGSCHYLMKNYANSAAIYRQACINYPKSPLAWDGLGQSLHRLGDYVNAQQALSQANLFDRQNSAIWCHIVELCLETGKISLANQALRELLKTEPDDAAPVNRLIEILEMQEDNSSLEDLKRFAQQCQ